MWTINEWILIGYLGILSVIDCKKKMLPRWMLVMGGVLVTAQKLLSMVSGKADVEGIIYSCLSGIGVGLLFLAFSRITNEMLGYGDSFLILILGVYMGLWDILEVLSLGFVFCGICSLVGLVFHKLSKKDTLPFVPFIFGGVIGVMTF